ncbi:N-acetylneuraminate synthase [candidate division WOR-1 bacterium RIFOXYB2_FULL_42_35]|uniref:N-acetylneuraminate synthase n=1 Tax=candidate division WOR-1 bacterium RIFOXYC2_FULL_41_25 TaxID=1802586 RepID=A0A1F4TKL0_UNCSA|nr:MAG: N-acetylneuraminate synthase [candidate division WOR-1 bacterium RIFOXYB2_FULL_42_35]OGC25588.1 MAG: N-acetylneuraminate synthase [candidate division WOR-1 bacterium RIFOXYA2_FULL_41_14]OGC33262.1 MAG: N-acetylneuraminate synthase [candidate division WOR-1 bacterium RIFOXYC2_FULL_41_25]OGC41374.1 MAG: N-acetylneuraminate synthase [candidate division WOR-1 bacterium RIFOXYD2_FULL_41_8]
MNKTVKIGKDTVGEGHPAYFIAEIGINHNGSVDIAKKLITVAAAAGCNAVKFQKRTPELCVPEAQRNLMRETPWGNMTYFDYRHKVEFGAKEYGEIDRFCKEVGITWFASPWDVDSVDFLEQYNLPCYKIPAAKLTDDTLLKHLRQKGRPIILSTGMSSLEQVDHAVEVLQKKDLILLHCCSAYPAQYEDLNLCLITYLKERYGVPVGYSGHETGLPTSVAAVTLGACVVERHITLDRAMWGSDHAASLEPNGLNRLMRDIKLVERSIGTKIKRILPSEEPLIKRLRNI